MFRSGDFPRIIMIALLVLISNDYNNIIIIDTKFKLFSSILDLNIDVTCLNALVEKQ